MSPPCKHPHALHVLSLEPNQIEEDSPTLHHIIYTKVFDHYYASNGNLKILNRIVT